MVPAILLLAVLVGCAGAAGGADAAQETDAVPETDAPTVVACDPDDPDPRGPACSQRVATGAEFDALSIGPTGIQYWERATKYLVPATDDPALIPPLVMNANRYVKHLDFLVAEFMPGLDPSAYMRMVEQRATRTYYAGNVIRIDDPDAGTLYGFTVYTQAKASEVPEPVEVRRVLDRLATVLTAGPLAFTFEPFDAMGPAKAKAWIDPGFPIWFPRQDAVKVEVYTPGAAYGRVRRFTVDAFDAAEAAGLLTYRDIVAIDSVPFDIEPVVAAVVTGGRQWELSHVNVRMARRGTPNLFVADALDALAAWDGALVRIEASRKSGPSGEDEYTVSAATEAEAEAWWASHRPKLDHVTPVDATYQSLDGLTSMDVDDDPVPLASRFGGKAANLAKLYAFLPAEHQVPGFGIPFAAFEAFLDATTIEGESLRERVHRLALDAAVASDPAFRAAELMQLRDLILTAGVVPQALTDAIATRIGEVFGSPGARVRFRSSSNVEDGVEFSGAGLYDSTTVWLDDGRTVENGLRNVWASLYNDRAWAERDWYQVPQDAASMAILVTPAFPDELANGVAFTGDPSDPAETRYLVNAQVGDEEVVTNDPAKVPEKDWLEITDGQVTHVDRVRSSTLATPGVPVLTDAQLGELGALMAVADASFPLDLEGHDRDSVLLDFEFKIQAGTGLLKIKQVRPFLGSGQPR
jgi:hypothetical protein